MSRSRRVPRDGNIVISLVWCALVEGVRPDEVLAPCLRHFRIAVAIILPNVQHRKDHLGKHPVAEVDKRPSITSIYFLLTRGEHSKWHVLHSDEAWHYYEGDPLELLVMNLAMEELQRMLLGPFSNDQRPVRVVPANHWQAARTLGDYTLVGCTVGPGFVFEDFRLLGEDKHEAARLRGAFGDLGRLL